MKLTEIKKLANKVVADAYRLNNDTGDYALSAFIKRVEKAMELPTLSIEVKLALRDVWEGLCEEQIMVAEYAETRG